MAILNTAHRLRNKLDDLDPDVVVSKLWSGNLATHLAVRGTPLERRTILYEDLDPVTHVAHIRLGRLKRRVIASVYRRHRGPIVANALTTAEGMRSQYGLVDDRIRVLQPMFPDGLPPCESSASEIRQRDPVLLTVGSLISRKGLEFIADSLATIDTPFRWVVVGEGPLRRKLELHPVFADGRAVLLGHRDNPYAEMSKASVLLHYPTSEAYGVVILEALASGLPVIASKVSGPIEIARQYGGVQLVEPSSPKDLGRAIVDFLESETIQATPPDRLLLLNRRVESIQDWKNYLAEVACASS